MANTFNSPGGIKSMVVESGPGVVFYFKEAPVTGLKTRGILTAGLDLFFTQ